MRIAMKRISAWLLTLAMCLTMTPWITGDAVAEAAAIGDPCTLALYIDANDGTSAGRIACSKPTGPYYVGDSITVRATANSGYTFVSWVNYDTEEVINTNEFTFVLKGDTEWTAVFKKNGEYFLFVNRPYGLLTADPAKGSYAPGTEITLSVPAESGRSVVYEMAEAEEDKTVDELNWIRLEDDTFTMPANDTWVRALYSINVTLECEGQGTAEISPDGPWYEGDTLTLTLTPDEGYYAQSVSGTTEAEVDGNTLTFKLDRTLDRTISVKFAQRTTTPVRFFITPADGGTVDISKDGNEITATATPSNGYHFLCWTDMSDNSILSEEASFTFQPTAAINVRAIFYLLARVAPGIEHGSLEIVNPKTVYASGDTITLQAHPDEGYIVDTYLAGEYHDGSATLSPIDGDSFVMPAWDMVASVLFVRGYTINAEASVAEGGTVFGAGTYREDADVVLTALPEEGYTFVGWEENGSIVSTDAEYSFTAEADRDLTAVFQEYTGMTFTVSASTIPLNGGTVTGTGSYEGGETVTLTAEPAEGFSFLNWSENGAVVSTDATYTFTANANRTLTANFQNDTGISYVDADGNDLICVSYTTITNGSTTLGTGWYAVSGNVTIPSRVTASGNVNLILCDDAQLTIPKGIRLTGSNSLTIWGQSEGTGALMIARTDENNAGIGGNEDECGGIFTMNGGSINVTGGRLAAGIGGGGDGHATEETAGTNTGMNTRGWAGTITVNGGSVTAAGGESGAGIGCGQRGNGGTISINGGTVNATGGLDSAAIGGAESSYAYHQSIETIHITGGNITATGGEKAAAIGGGLWCRIGDVTIDGGTIHAYGGDESAGIGGGYFGADGIITINDGSVTAVGGENGAGIGGGRCLYGTVMINGGTVNATGGASGAGIGGGHNLGTAAYTTGTVTITGGDITATGGTSRTASGAGIGGGAYGPGGNVTISGGTIRATSGTHYYCNGAGIGGGFGASGGTVTISDGTVNATGGDGGAGIGSGSNYHRDQTLESGTVNISGGSVTAKGGKFAAGIGGGYGVAGGNVTISGGNNNIAGGDRADGNPGIGGGAGIGGGYNAAGGSFTFTGGTTRVTSGDWEDSDHMAQAVGHGDHVVNCDGTVSFGDSNTHVRVGIVWKSNSIDWANASSRENYSRSKARQTVIFETCEPHSFNRDGICDRCGAAGGPVLQNKSYVNATGQPQSDKYCLPVTASTTTWNTSGAHGGWYAATESLNISSRVTVSGNINLILCDGATLTIPEGVEVSEGNSLTIWRQSGATGALLSGTTNGSDVSCAAGDAGIGGSNGQNAGNITIYGGNITAVPGSGAQAVGHGSGASDSGSLNLLCMRVFDSAGASAPVSTENRTSVCRGSWVKFTACTEHQMAHGVCELCDLHESVTYLDPQDGNQHSCQAYIPYTGQTTLTSGWYVLADNITTSQRVTVTGDANLILSDGKMWNADSGIEIGANGSLTVWAQSGGTGMGALIATGETGKAGINNTDSKLTINGGAISATGGENGAGVGGDSEENGGDLTIISGTLTAVGSIGAQAIGSGSGGTDSGVMNATLFKACYVDSSGNVLSWATGRTKKAACRNTDGAAIRLELCSSHTDSDADGFCDLCEAVYYYNPSDESLNLLTDFTLYTGQETLNTGWYAVDESREVSQRVEVTGNVNLVLTDGVELSMLKGIRVAEGNSLTIWAYSTDGDTAGRLTATGDSGNAGIGGNSAENGGDITFLGGSITVRGGKGAQAIGGGRGSSNPGNLDLDLMRVGTVNDENGITWTTSAKRTSLCRSATQMIRLELCGDHLYTAFRDNGDGTHTACCEFCGLAGTTRQPHSYNEEHLCVCGAADGIVYVDPTDTEHPVKVCHGSYNTVIAKTISILSSGWYVVNGDTDAEYINITGDVNLILMDGSELRSKKIKVTDDNSLTIWGQSGGTGRLTVYYSASGNFTCMGCEENGQLTINGGTITVTCPNDGTCLGGDSSSSVTINGGSVNLTSRHTCIGGERGQDGGNINITGGTVTANANGLDAAIGGGGLAYNIDAGSGGNITISGGTVTINATGGGPGIGGGSSNNNSLRGGDGGNITITGGTVKVNTVGSGASIGGGNSGTGNGGNAGNITITGGTITVNGSGKWAIGPGINFNDSEKIGEMGSLTLGDDIIVTAGSNEESAQPVSKDERVNALQSNTWVKIETVIPEPTYTATVSNGSGSDDYKEGESVTIVANAPAEGMQFKEWTGAEGLTFTSGSPTTSEATFTMPARAVTLTATYEKKQDPAQGGGNDDNGGGTGTGDNGNGSGGNGGSSSDNGKGGNGGSSSHSGHGGNSGSTNKPESGDQKPAETPQQTEEQPQVTEPSTIGEDSTPLAGAHVFKDVAPDAYYAEPVAWALKKGITKGISEDSFGAEEKCTRGQVLTFIYRAAGSPAVTGNGTSFTDVASDAYYRDAVAWAVEMGITSGTSGTTFSPDETCTRGQIVTLLWRAAGQPKVETSGSFTDVTPDMYCSEAVAWAVSIGITLGTSDTTFSPDEICDRGQVVTFLYRYDKTKN